ncbi:MAG: RnfABCDGE type electron transport complex subunit D [Oscillospiraceae bacterium]|nr:RnfABCDGE type electron transport complex subunit D [Oscillospiraceae bacterium]
MNKLTVGQHPHIRSNQNTKDIMLDVIIALLPCIIAGLLIFGYRSVVILAIAVISAVFFEWIACKIFKMKSSIWDLSAVVSGIILTMNLPASVPLWIPIVGSLFMIVIIKMCFGGLGRNFINPAAGARVFLVASFPVIMTHFVAPGARLGLWSVDAVSSATPLGIAAMGENLDLLPSYLSLYFGNIGGCIGETSALAILIGFVYLMWRRVISWEVPAIYVGTVAILALIFGRDPLFHVLSGGLLFGAVFMATDYTTSPLSKIGRIIFAFGLGLMTIAIRLWGGYPEGVCLSIILMNVVVPYLDKIKPKRFGAKTLMNNE